MARYYRNYCTHLVHGEIWTQSRSIMCRSNFWPQHAPDREQCHDYKAQITAKNKCLRVKCLLFSSICNKNRKISTNFIKNPKHDNSHKSVERKSCCSMRKHKQNENAFRTCLKWLETWSLIFLGRGKLIIVLYLKHLLCSINIHC
jgi:hypothetical protein